MNRNLTKTLLLLVCLSTQGLAVNDNQTSFDFSKLKPKELAYESCDHQLDGCYLKESGQIEYRSKARQDLDRMFSCKNDNSCSESDIIRQESIYAATYTPEELKDLFNRYEDSNPLTKKSYWIPLDTSNQNLIKIALATSLGVVFYKNDQEIVDYFQERRSPNTQKVADFANLFGKEVIAPAALGTYFIGVVFDNGKLKEFGLITTVTGLATQVVVEGFKRSFGRSRPIHGHGAYNFGSGEKSFVSGHSAGAWSFATAISHSFGDNHKWVPYVSYTLAALTSLARIHDNKHWASDVFAGALVGHYLTKFLINFYESRTDSGLKIFPTLNPEDQSFHLQLFYIPNKNVNKSPLKCRRLPEGSKERIQACILEAYEISKLQDKIF